MDLGHLIDGLQVLQTSLCMGQWNLIWLLDGLLFFWFHVILVVHDLIFMLLLT